MSYSDIYLALPITAKGYSARVSSEERRCTLKIHPCSQRCTISIHATINITHVSMTILNIIDLQFPNPHFD